MKKLLISLSMLIGVAYGQDIYSVLSNADSLSISNDSTKIYGWKKGRLIDSISMLMPLTAISDTIPTKSTKGELGLGNSLRFISGSSFNRESDTIPVHLLLSEIRDDSYTLEVISGFHIINYTGSVKENYYLDKNKNRLKNVVIWQSIAIQNQTKNK